MALTIPVAVASYVNSPGGFRTAISGALSSKKFLAFIVSMIVLWGNRLVGHLAPGYEMDPNEVALAVGSLATYMLGQGIADHGKPQAAAQNALAAALNLPDGDEKVQALRVLAGVSTNPTTTPAPEKAAA